MTGTNKDDYALTIRSGRDAVTEDTPGRVRLLSRFVREYFRPHRAAIALALVAMLIYAATVTALPKLFEVLVDEVFVRRTADALGWIIIAVIGIFSLRAAAAFIQQYVLARVANRVSEAVQKRFVAHVLSLDLAFFQKNSVGQIVARGTEDVNVLNQTATNLIVMIGRDFFTMIGLVGYVLWTSPQWFGLALLGAPLIAVPTAIATRRIRRLARQGQSLNGDLIGAFEEAFHAIRSIKAEANERIERARLSDTVTTRRRVAIHIARMQALLMPILDVVTAIALIAVLMVGGSAVMSGDVEPGQLMAFVGALMLLADPLRRLLQVNAMLQLCLAAIERIYEVLDMEPRIVSAPEAVALAQPDGDIVFENVRFGYEPGKPVLNELNLTIPAGAMLAVIGESGSGKTSLFNLLARLYEVESGAVRIGGQEVRAVALDSLRSSLALVAQDTLLFDATIRENIAYGRPDADEAGIRAALEHADAWAFVQNLPGGLDFAVGPRGSRLSGGQRQRIALARALLRNAPILLLDEATSALDAATELRVLEGIRRARAGRTTIMIAHRLAVSGIASRIAVLREGRVAEEGSPDELLAKQGAYAHAMQLGNSRSGSPEVLNFEQ